MRMSEVNHAPGGEAMMSFTVCIPVYNGSAFLGEILASIAEQDLRGVTRTALEAAFMDETTRRALLRRIDA